MDIGETGIFEVEEAAMGYKRLVDLGKSKTGIGFVSLQTPGNTSTNAPAMVWANQGPPDRQRSKRLTRQGMGRAACAWARGGRDRNVHGAVERCMAVSEFLRAEVDIDEAEMFRVGGLRSPHLQRSWTNLRRG